MVLLDLLGRRWTLRVLWELREERVLNFRSPRLNLEAVYGGGPTGSPYLFDRDDPLRAGYLLEA